MTRDRDARAIVCLALAGATLLVAAVILSTRPAPAADDAQSFWREIQPAATPRKARRIMVTYRLHRSVRTADRGRPDARGTNKSILGTRASGPDPRSVLGGSQPFAGPFVVRHAQVTPGGDDADTFARRMLLPEPTRDVVVPSLLKPRDPPLPIFSPPRERREPNNNRRRELVAVVIVVAVLGGMSSYLFSQRGAAHV